LADSHRGNKKATRLVWHPPRSEERQRIRLESD
jgi:hypothetical protein